MNRALIIVPHPDDEINVAGCIMEPLKQKGYEVVVAICSNGDSYPQLTKERYQEALKVKKLLGYDRLIYLGYGDGYKGSHIYDLKDEAIAKSFGERTSTFHPVDGKEFCYDHFGVHKLYTRNNFKDDIKELIISEKANILICVDLDVHPDHRCVSLLFDEVMGEILRFNKDYRPLILKKFAYMGVWHGEDDYFDTVVQVTKPTILGVLASSYPYNWEDRIQFKTPPHYYRTFFWNTPLFKALSSYRTQSVTTNPINCCISSMKRQVNRDTVYWLRRTDNKLYNAIIKVSSGDPSFLTDFKVYDTDSVKLTELLESKEYWTPSSEDKEATISCEFPSSTRVSSVIIYQHSNYSIKKIRVSSNTSFSRTYTLDCKPVVRIDLSCGECVRNLEFRILEGYNDQIRIGEIEVFDIPEEIIIDRIPLERISKADPTIVRNKFLCIIQKSIFDFYSRVVVKYNRTKWRKVYDT